MTFTGASLADGQVATTWGAIYTSTGVKTIIKSARFHNTNAATQTLELRINRSAGGTSKDADATLLQSERCEWVTDGEVITLSSGDAIEAQTTTATAVDYMITGATE